MQTIIITSENRESANSYLLKNYKMSEIDGNSMVVESESGKKISIAQARGLIKFLCPRPAHSKQKFALIRDAQIMTVEAQNSLLKLIEEPPSYLQIILTVNNPKNLLDTILSRCIVIRAEKIKADFPSSDFDDAFKEFIEVINMSIGERFDWFSSNQMKFKDRSFAVEFLSRWELFLRHFLVASVGVSYALPLDFPKKLSTKEWQENLVYLKEVIEKIRVNNANISMGIESFLINLPVFSETSDLK